MELQGKRALVTGAGTNGIGRAVVRALARAGADVAIHHFRTPEGAGELAADLAKAGRNAPVVEADFADPAAARQAVRAAVSDLGGLDILVNCAATLARVPFLEITDTEWSRVHDINLRAAFAVGQEAARHMVQDGVAGRIIFISSVNQSHPTRDLAHYVASKGGVRMLARSMALELAPHKITVNLIAPGTVETDLNRQALADPAFRQKKLDLIPMNSIADPADIGATAAYLAGPGAGYLTGTTITVDGGLTL